MAETKKTTTRRKSSTSKKVEEAPKKEEKVEKSAPPEDNNAKEDAQLRKIGNLADKVMRGALGVGEKRKKALGSNYDAVMAEVLRRRKAGA